MHTCVQFKFIMVLSGLRLDVYASMVALTESREKRGAGMVGGSISISVLANMSA